MINPPNFHETELDRFWKFVHERHSIYHRRFVLGLPRSEWTQDEILKKNKFTNIYRELDPGTQFSINEIMSIDPYTDPRYIHLADGPDLRPDIVFNVMLYRLMCSIPTYEGYGFQLVRDFDEKDFETYLSEIYESNRPVFGNAYLISPYSHMGFDLKYQNVARLFGLLRGSFLHGNFFEKLDTAPSFESAFKVINSHYGFGPFLAYQVMVDLTYPLPDTRYGSAIVPWSQNDWVRLGPGALRGYGRVTSSRYVQTTMKWLQSHQESEFLRVGVHFPWLRQPNGEKVELTLANLQNCFCEFHKYRSIQEGVGKAQRLFVPREERG